MSMQTVNSASNELLCVVGLISLLDRVTLTLRIKSMSRQRVGRMARRFYVTLLASSRFNVALGLRRKP